MIDAVRTCKSEVTGDIGFVGEARPELQESASIVDKVPTARTIKIPSSVQSFLKIRDVYCGSNLQIICRKFGSDEQVTFYVHREIVTQKCAFFADGQSFTAVGQR